MVKIYIIAGEASGDFIGARLADALRDLCGADNRALSLRGVGGDQMQTASVDLLFHCNAISVMGLLEIVPHIRRIKRLIAGTIADIQAFAPDVVVTIDSSGFCNRVIDGVKKAHGNSADPLPRFVHYVAPPVWAWRPGRAKTLAIRIDHLLCLFPFEPPYFECHGLQTTHVGHPLVELNWSTPKITGAAPQICLLPGSRAGEIKRHLVIFAQTMSHFPDATIVVPTFERFRSQILAALPNAHVVTDTAAKRQVMMESDVALAASGTISLELALSRTPAIIAYRASPITAFFVRRMIKIPFAALPNILLGRKIVPEYLQEQCTVANLVQGLKILMVEKRQDGAFFDQVRSQLLPSQSNDTKPSYNAAKVILNYV